MNCGNIGNMQGLIHKHKHERKAAKEAEEAVSGGAVQTPRSQKFLEKLLDRITLLAGILGPLMVFPQIYKIFSSHNAAGVSALSWGAFAVLDIPFIFYGIYHKDKPIVITYAMFCVANSIVAVGALIYK